MNKKILIIGSEGFIGKHLYYFYSQMSDCQVITADIVASEAANHICFDAYKPDFDAIFEKHIFDFCVNASGAANVSESINSPLNDYNCNTYNIFLILNAIKKHSPNCKFVHLSSAAVYGNPQILPITEQAHIKPLSPYGFHKIQAELICEEFAQIFKLNTCSLRIFSAYGKGLKKQLFWDLYQKCKNSEAIELFGTGNETRDFIYIDDLIQVIDIIINKADFSGEAYNVANGTEILIKDAVRHFVEALGWKGTVKFSGMERKGDPNNWRSDISLITKLGYSSVFDFKKGIKAYCDWLKEID